tara:strand:- start:1624 stop:6198 length:4575 start_codon:yes stop_codon:yes gene_type:complete
MSDYEYARQIEQEEILTSEISHLTGDEKSRRLVQLVNLLIKEKNVNIKHLKNCKKDDEMFNAIIHLRVYGTVPEGFFGTPKSTNDHPDASHEPCGGEETFIPVNLFKYLHIGIEYGTKRTEALEKGVLRHGKHIYYPTQFEFNKDEKESWKKIFLLEEENKSLALKVLPFKKLSEFIIDDHTICINEGWLKVFDYDFEKFKEVYESEINEQTNDYERKFLIKKDGRSKIVKKGSKFYQFHLKSGWKIDGFEDDDSMPLPPQSPQGVDQIDEIDEYELPDEVIKNIGDEYMEGKAVEQMEQKAKEEAQDEELEATQGKKPTWRRYINFINLSTSERITRDKIYVEGGLIHIENILSQILSRGESDQNVIDKSKPTFKLQNDSEKELLDNLAKFDYKISTEYEEKRFGEILANFLMSVFKKYSLPIKYSYIYSNSQIKVNLCDKYGDKYSSFNMWEHMIQLFSRHDQSFAKAKKSKSDNSDLFKLEENDKVKVGKKSIANYMKTRTWMKLLVEKLNDYIHTFKNKIPMSEIDKMFDATSPKSLYRIIIEARVEMLKDVYDHATRQYGRGGTREAFMNSIMKIESCFQFDSFDDVYYSYEDAYYFSNKLGEWCFNALNEYDIRIGTSTFGFIAGKIKDDSIWKTKSTSKDDDDVFSEYSDAFGLFLSHLKRDFFEEENKYSYMNHFGDIKQIELQGKSKADEKKALLQVESIDKHYFNFNVESWLKMFESGVKKGLFFKFIEKQVEMIVERENEEKGEQSDIEEDVEREMKFIEYRIWKLLMRFKLPPLNKSNNNTPWKVLIPNEKTVSPFYVDEFDEELRKNAYFHLKHEKERLEKEEAKLIAKFKQPTGEIKDERLKSIVNEDDDGFIVKNNIIINEILPKLVVLGERRNIFIDGIINDKKLATPKTKELDLEQKEKILEQNNIKIPYDNEKERREILRDTICGFIDVYSADIYTTCSYSKRAVAKYIGKRLDTPEKVYNMYYNWSDSKKSNSDEDHHENDSDEVIEDMSKIMCRLWTMDVQTESMANCIKYFNDKDKDGNNENLRILKKIWDKWMSEDKAKTLSYSNLHTKLMPIIEKERLFEIRKVFVDINKQGELVKTGDYKLCRVRKIRNGENDPEPVLLNGKKYWICEILSQPSDNKFNVEYPVTIEDVCFQLPEKKDVKQNTINNISKDVIDESYELEEFSEFHHVRLGSWNVACMNGPDIPTTIEEYDLKFGNITDVIHESCSNIVALQELPNELKLKNNKDTETIIRKFEPDIMNTIKSLLKKNTGSEWDIKYHPVNHSIDSLGPGETLDARKNRKEIYAFVYNTSVVRYLHPDQGKTNKVEDRRSLDVRFARCPIISNFCSNKLEFTLCTVHLPPTDKKVKTYKEIQDLGEKVFPGLISTFGEKKAKSVIFLGDFNMGYTQKKKLLPRPTADTWEKFTEQGYVPCIKNPTNVLQNMHYDNIWMHHTMADLTISKAGDSNTGVIKVNEIEGTPFVIGSTLAEGFKKRVSDHNLVYVDLRSNEVMPWSSSNVVLKRDN